MQRVCAVFERSEEVGDVRVMHRLTGVIRDKVLFRHISHIVALVILGEQVIIRLLFLWPCVLGNRLVPFLSVGEFGIYIENYASERVLTVTDNLT